MPRTLSTNLQTLLAQNRSSVCHLLSFAVGSTIYRFAEDQASFEGHVYKAGLILNSPIKASQTLLLNPVTIHLHNITLETAAMLQLEGAAAQGVEATLRRLYLAANEAVTLFVGRVAEIDIDQNTAAITLAGEIDPTASQVPARKYSATCVWDFKDSNCGYTNGIDPADSSTGAPFTSCPKDFFSCVARGRQRRFPGFIHISRDLTLSIEGQAPASQAGVRTLADLIRPWEQA
jgi:hypothetical protein